MTHWESGLRLLLSAILLSGLLCNLAPTSAAQQGTEGQPGSTKDATPQVSVSGAADQFEIAPGLPLPTNGVVWLVNDRKDKPELVRVRHSNPKFNRHVGQNVARSVVWARQAATVDLPNPTAKTRIDGHLLVILVRKSIEEDEEMESEVNDKTVPSHYALVRMRVENDHRVLSSYSFAQFTGKPTRKEDEVATSNEEIAGGVWIKMTPKQPLPDGEYSVVRLPSDKKAYEATAFDFGVGNAAKQPARN